jgi:hypothetical protein
MTNPGKALRPSGGWAGRNGDAALRRAGLRVTESSLPTFFITSLADDMRYNPLRP